MKIAVMSDTNCGILPKKAKELGITLLHMPFFVDGEEFFEYGSMGYEEFFERLSAGASVSTSQPSPADLCDMWEELLKHNDYVIYIPMSSALSGTYQTAKMLSEDYGGRVLVADTKRISVTLKACVLDALKMVKQGIQPEKIIEKLEQNSKNSSIYIAVNSLENLKKSGRITPSGAAIGSLLGIKPVLQIQGEKLDAYKKVRGMTSAMETMLSAVKTDLETRFKAKSIVISTGYSGNLSQGQAWQQKVQEYFSDYKIELDALPVSISCHIGTGALGIAISQTE